MTTKTPSKSPEDSEHLESQPEPRFPINKNPRGGVMDDQNRPSGDASDPRGPGPDKVVTPQDLKSAESSTSRPSTGTIGAEEKGLMGKAGDTVGKGYTGDEAPSRFRRLRGVFTRRRAAAGGGVVVIAVGGVMLFGVSQGPLQVIHLSQTLMKNFQGQESAGKSRMRQIYRWAKTGDVGETRLSFLQSRSLTRLNGALDKVGVTVSKTNSITNQIEAARIDVEKNPNYRGLTEKQAIAQIEKDYPNAKVNKIGGAGGLDGKGLVVAVRDPGVSGSNKLIVESIGLAADEGHLSKIRAGMGTRTLEIYYQAPKWWHPIKRLDAIVDNKKAAAYKSWSDKRNKKIAERSEKAKARTAKLRQKFGESKSVTIGSSALLVAGGLCVARDVATEIPEINRESVVIPSMASAADAISLGDQIKSGDDFSIDQIGAIVKAFTGKDGKNIWQAKALQSELGNKGGEEIDPNIKQAFSPDNSATEIKNTIDSLGGDAICSTLGQVVQGVSGAALLVLGPGGWIAKGVNTAAGAGLVAAVTEFLPKLLAEDSLTGMPHEGPKGGNVDAYGARELANTSFRASGGAPLTKQQSASLKKDLQLEDERDFRSKSFAERIFDLEDNRSLFGSMVTKTSVYNNSNLVKIAGSLFSWPSALGSLSPKSLAANTGESYDYGFPEYGFSKEDLANSDIQNPYANAEKVAQLLDGSDAEDYIKKADTCFGVELSKGENGWNAIAKRDVNPTNDTYNDASCADSSDPNWLRMRFFIFDTRLATIDDCYYGEEDSCKDIGISSPQEQGGSASAGTVNVDGTVQELAKRLVDSGKLSDQDGRYMSQIKALANGDGSCSVNPTILKMLVGIIEEGHTITMSSLNRRCTGVLTASGTASYHYREGGGHAVDVVSFDGQGTNGGNAASVKYLKLALKYIPSGSGVGQFQAGGCGASFDFPEGISNFADSCNHVHIQVPIEGAR